MSDEHSTNPRVAVITGAGSGIGAAIATRLSRAGWRIYGCGRNLAKLESVAARCAGAFVPVECDVTDWEQVQALAARLDAPLDLLVHNAGFGQCQNIDDLDVAEWSACLAVAATGAFLTAKALLPKLRAGGPTPGHVIQIASLASGGSWNMEIGYGTAKGAQLKFHLHLVNQLAAEVASGGRLIHAHAICPGSVFTPFWDRIPQRPQSAADCLEADEVAWLVEQVIAHPDWTAADHAEHAPRTEVRIAPHAPWVDEGSVMEIKHVAHG